MRSSVGFMIRQRRQQLGYSQTTLARRAKVTQGWISRLENRVENPTLNSLTQIAKALDVEVIDLLSPRPDDHAAFH